MHNTEGWTSFRKEAIFYVITMCDMTADTVTHLFYYLQQMFGLCIALLWKLPEVVANMRSTENPIKV